MFLGQVTAQEKIKYQPDYDAKALRFGYYIGTINTSYIVKYNRSILASGNNQNVYSILSPTTTGIKAGAIITYHLNDYYDLRFTPLSIAIYSRKLIENQTTEYKQNDKAWFEIPLQVKYKSERRLNSRMFMFAGVKYGFETNVVNRKITTSSFATKSSDFSIEYGFGLELFREYFKITPEIHFSHGVRDMAKNNNSPSNFLFYTDKLRTHGVSFILVFQ
jgi:hypothetical protein